MTKTDLNKILKEIYKTENFKKLKKEFPNLYLFSIFFTLEIGTDERVGLRRERNIIEFDFYLDSKNVAVFSYPELNLKISKTLEKSKKPQKLQEINLSLEQVEKIIKKEAEKTKSKIKKAIILLYKTKNDVVWNINCILDSLKILNIRVSDNTGKVISLEEREIFDIFKNTEKD